MSNKADDFEIFEVIFAFRELRLDGVGRCWLQARTGRATEKNAVHTWPISVDPAGDFPPNQVRIDSAHLGVFVGISGSVPCLADLLG